MVGSAKQSPVFGPLDLEIIDLVYEVVWTQIKARDPYRDATEDPERQKLLRQHVFAAAIPGAVEFDTLLDRILADIPATCVPYTTPSTAPSSARNN